jgi:hypothetical protein
MVGIHNDGTVFLVVEWSKRQRQTKGVKRTVWIMRYDGQESSLERRSLEGAMNSALGTLMGSCRGEFTATVEAIEYYGKSRGNRLITLAEAAGMAVGMLMGECAGYVHRPTYHEWRLRQLGLKRGTRADVAEVVAVKRARQLHPGRVWRGHAAESLWIARDGMTQHRRAILASGVK